MTSGEGSRARRMQLLARVEQARETRCRSAFREAAEVLARARARAEAADAEAEREGRQRHDRLRGAYAAMHGTRDALAVHALRATELQMAAREAAALQERDQAALAANAASELCRAASDALRLASLRSERRSRLARELGSQEAAAARHAEEEEAIDEVMDRIGAAS